MPVDIKNRCDLPPSDSNYRWLGPDTTVKKTADAGILARRKAFSTVEKFAEWRAGKGMPVLSPEALLNAFAQWRSESVTETAALNPLTEKRIIGAGNAGVHAARKF